MDGEHVDGTAPDQAPAPQAQQENSYDLEIANVPTFNNYTKFLFSTSNVLLFNPRPLNSASFGDEYAFHREDKENHWEFQREMRWRFKTDHDIVTV